MFLPLFAESERAAASGLNFLKYPLASEFYIVAWPLDRQLPISDQRVQLLANLDDAIGKLPPDTVVVVDATSSLRQILALEVMAYINHRREPLKAGGLRLLLCWPTALKDELMSNAPDLWSVRAASPWLEEQETTSHEHLPALREQANPRAKRRPGSLAMAEKLQRWRQYKNLKDADFSAKDALGLAAYQHSNLQFESAAELANAVIRSIDGQSKVLDDKKIIVDALNIYSTALKRLGNVMAALETSKTAVFNARQLAETNPAAYEPDLAMSINNLANVLSETGDRPGALKAAQEAVDICKRLAKTNPAAYEPDLAMSINNLAGFLSETGDRSGGLKAAQEAVDIYKRLAKTNPAAYEPDLAMSINNLANHLSETGDRSNALKAAKEAVEIYKHLAKINSAAYEPVWAMSINNLAASLSETGDSASALKAAQEAVDIRRRLTKANPAAYEPALAASINNLANFLSETGDRSGALKAAQEAVALYEKANRQTPGAFEQQLARARRVLDGFG